MNTTPEIIGHHRDPPLHRRHRAGRRRRPAPASRQHPVRPGRPRRLVGLRHPDVVPARHGGALEAVRLARRRGAHQRAPQLPDRDRRADDPLRARAVRRAGSPDESPGAAPGPHLPRLVPRVPAAHRPADRRRLRPRHPLDARLRVLDPGRRRRLDDGTRGPHLGHPDARARLLVVRRARLRRRCAGRPRAGDPGPRRLPRRARPAAVLLPVGRPGRVRGLRPEGVRGARAHAVVPVRRRLQRDERLASADRGRRPVRQPGRPARLLRAVRELRQRDLARHARAGAGAGDVVLAHEHGRRLGPLPLRGGARASANPW